MDEVKLVEDVNTVKEQRRRRKKKNKRKKNKNDHPLPETEATVAITGKKRKAEAIENDGGSTGDGKKAKQEKRKKSLKSADNDAELNPSKEQDEEILYPYEVQAEDHCETPIEAYEDLQCFLNFIGEKLNKTPEQLFIYDPFFCEGSMVERMTALGYKNVYNRKEDFYQVQESNSVPDYDVLMTNPPYSQDHMEKLVRFCVNSRKPFALLVPNYVYTKDYYSQIPGTNQIFYITPSQGRRYLYSTPKGRRQKKSSKYTSPFPTFWFCYIPPSFPTKSVLNPQAPAFVPSSIIQQARQQAERIDLARSKHEIPLSVSY